MCEISGLLLSDNNWDWLGDTKNKEIQIQISLENKKISYFTWNFFIENSDSFNNFFDRLEYYIEKIFTQIFKSINNDYQKLDAFPHRKITCVYLFLDLLFSDEFKSFSNFINTLIQYKPKLIDFTDKFKETYTSKILRFI